MENYTNISLLSLGTDSMVYSAVSTKDRQTYVLKMVKQPKAQRDGIPKEVLFWGFS